jgi:competence protein ComEC
MKRRTKRLVALVIIVVTLIIIAYAFRAEIEGIGDKIADRNKPNDSNKQNPDEGGPRGASSTNATVSFIDVGEGDSILIQTPDNKSVLMDAGPENASARIVSYLNARNITTLDALIITHPDADHIAAADEVLEALAVKAVFHSGYVKDTASYREFINATNAEGCPVYTDAQVHVGDMLNLSANITFQVLNIDSHAATVNDASIVLKMVDGSVGFMFTGDASSDVESKIIAYHAYNLTSQILKVGHHGSSTSTSDAWLSAVDPSIVAISVGAGNTYGHPSPSLLDLLSAHHATIYRTDLNGTVTITTNGVGWCVS